MSQAEIVRPVLKIQAEPAKSDGRLGFKRNELSERQSGNALAFLCSLIAHVSLLLILACWAYTSGKDSRGVVINAEIAESEFTSLSDIQSFELSVDDTQEQKLESETNFRMDVNIQAPVLDPLPFSGASTTLTATSVDQVVESLRRPGSGKGASFFGAYAEGNRFVFILDSSKSMKGERWTYACTQLLDSLKGLNADQQFMVICFDQETTFLFNKPPELSKYHTPDDEKIERVKNWLRSRTLGKATMPAQSLLFALDLNPDAIFLLSDGELMDNSAMMLRRVNSNVSSVPQIPIHTVHLFSSEGRETLKRIAAENSGTFTPVQGKRRFGRLGRR